MRTLRQRRRGIRPCRFHVLALSIRAGLTKVAFPGRYEATRAANEFRRDGFLVLQWG